MLALFASSDAGDTWGIPGPLFAVLYPAVGVALILAVRQVCRRLGDRPARDDECLTDVAELACLSHRSLPIETAVAQLIRDGVLADGTPQEATPSPGQSGRRSWWKGRAVPESGREPEPEPVPDAVAPGVHILPLPPGDATPLTRAVHAALVRAASADGTLAKDSLTRDALARDAEVSAEVARLELALRGRGLILATASTPFVVASCSRRSRSSSASGRPVSAAVWMTTSPSWCWRSR